MDEIGVFTSWFGTRKDNFNIAKFSQLNQSIFPRKVASDQILLMLKSFENKISNLWASNSCWDVDVLCFVKFLCSFKSAFESNDSPHSSHLISLCFILMWRFNRLSLGNSWKLIRFNEYMLGKQWFLKTTN